MTYAAVSPDAVGFAPLEHVTLNDFAVGYVKLNVEPVARVVLPSFTVIVLDAFCIAQKYEP